MRRRRHRMVDLILRLAQSSILPYQWHQQPLAQLSQTEWVTPLLQQLGPEEKIRVRRLVRNSKRYRKIYRQ